MAVHAVLVRPRQRLLDAVVERVEPLARHGVRDEDAVLAVGAVVEDRDAAREPDMTGEHLGGGHRLPLGRVDHGEVTVDDVFDEHAEQLALGGLPSGGPGLLPQGELQASQVEAVGTQLEDPLATCAGAHLEHDEQAVEVRVVPTGPGDLEQLAELLRGDGSAFVPLGPTGGRDGLGSFDAGFEAQASMAEGAAEGVVELLDGMVAAGAPLGPTVLGPSGVPGELATFRSGTDPVAHDVGFVVEILDRDRTEHRAVVQAAGTDQVLGVRAGAGSGLDARAGHRFPFTVATGYGPVAFDGVEAGVAGARASPRHAVLEDLDVGVERVADAGGGLVHGPVDRLGNGAALVDRAGARDLDGLFEADAGGFGQRLHRFEGADERRVGFERVGDGHGGGSFGLGNR